MSENVKPEADHHPHPVRLSGLSCLTPPHWIQQDDAARLAQDLQVSDRWLDALPVLYRKSRVDRRFSVLLEHEHGETASRQSFYSRKDTASPCGPSTEARMQVYESHAVPLAVAAGQHALTRSNTNPAEITDLIVVTCTGFCSPGVDLLVIEQLQLPSHTHRTHIGFMGCHGAINGLRVAQRIAQANADAKILLIAVELCSIHQQYTDDPQQLVANSLFADGCAAMVVQSDRSRTSTSNGQDFMRETSPWQIHGTACQTIPDTTGMMSWRIGDSGFKMSLDPKIPEVIHQKLPGFVQGWLESLGLSISQIDGWAIHPGGPRVVEAAGKALALTEDQLSPTLHVLRNFGNMSSPTVCFILDEIAKHQPAVNRVVLLAFGPGLSIEAALLSRTQPAV